MSAKGDLGMKLVSPHSCVHQAVTMYTYPQAILHCKDTLVNCSYEWLGVGNYPHLHSFFVMAPLILV